MGKWSVKRIFFGMLAAAVTLLAVMAAAFCRDKAPVLLYVPEEASTCVEAVMEAICSGDYSSAEDMLYGHPDLGMDVRPEGAVNRAFWKAFQSSLDYELMGPVYATESGLAQDVKIISMELSAATEHLSQRAEALLQEGIRNAEDTADIYDADNGYKESFVSEVMSQAARQALEEDVRYIYRVVTLQLVHENDRWWVVADRQLINAISGGTVG